MEGGKGKRGRREVEREKEGKKGGAREEGTTANYHIYIQL